MKNTGKNDSNRFHFSAKILLLGLMVTQILSTFHVYLSNIDFYENTKQILEAGYPAVPNALTLPEMKTLTAAFSGGLFFTLTIGCFLSLATLAYTWIVCRFFHKKFAMMIPGLAVWALTLYFINAESVVPLVTAYFIVIPLVVGLAVMISHPQDRQNRDIKTGIFVSLPFFILVAAGALTVNGTIFMDFRDKILLSNALGIKVNDFYYRYTLYPAEMIKPLEQKRVKTVRLANIGNTILENQLKKKLLLHDYVPISGAMADLILSQTGTALSFRHKEKTILSVSQKEFLSRPHLVLKKFSDHTDAFSFFRKTIFISLLVGLPISVYLLVFGGVQYFLSFFTGNRAAAMCACIICLGLGLGMMFFLQSNRHSEMEPPSFAEHLAASDPLVRTAAIKAILTKKEDITRYDINETHLKSPYIPERYWLARALGESSDKIAEHYLAGLLDDASINVRCKVYQALGKTKNRAFIPVLLLELNASDHAYGQLYAYHALKELGWRQTVPR